MNENPYIPVVDDDRDIVRAIATLLELEGYNVMWGFHTPRLCTKTALFLRSTLNYLMMVSSINTVIILFRTRLAIS